MLSGDLLPLFFKKDRLKFVGPPFVLAIRRPEIHNPIWDYSVKLQYCYFQMSGPFFRSVPWCFVVVTDKTHTFPKLTTFIRLVFDTFGRDPNNRMTVSCTFPSVCLNTNADWVYQTDSCLSGDFLLLHHFSLRSLPCDRGPGEGELSRSRLPRPLPFSWFMSCLELHDSPLEHFPFATHCLHPPVFPSLLLLLSSAFLLMEAALAVLSFRASKFRSCVICSKYLLTIFFKRVYLVDSFCCTVS